VSPWAFVSTVSTVLETVALPVWSTADTVVVADALAVGVALAVALAVTVGVTAAGALGDAAVAEVGELEGVGADLAHAPSRDTTHARKMMPNRRTIIASRYPDGPLAYVNRLSGVKSQVLLFLNGLEAEGVVGGAPWAVRIRSMVGVAGKGPTGT
jgi:hypothetical protein